MKLNLTAMALGLALIAGTASADVASRQALMKTFGGASKTLGEMAGGGAYDAAAATAAKAALVDGAAKIAAEYEENINDATSEAKPEIWTNWEDFLIKAKALGDAAGALDVSSAETIGAGMGAIGGTCKDCHTSYRVAK